LIVSDIQTTEMGNQTYKQRLQKHIHQKSFGAQEAPRSPGFPNQRSHYIKQKFSLFLNGDRIHLRGDLRYTRKAGQRHSGSRDIRRRAAASSGEVSALAPTAAGVTVDRSVEAQVNCRSESSEEGGQSDGGEELHFCWCWEV
jgi:hypothetical protein